VRNLWRPSPDRQISRHLWGQGTCRGGQENPLGVRGRTFDNRLIRERLKGEPNEDLRLDLDLKVGGFYREGRNGNRGWCRLILPQPISQLN
jgi:hypothetical protein